MYKIVWDKETGGVLLQSSATPDTLGIAPRPVFFEELNLIGLDKLGWRYPTCPEPIMWAVNKQYYAYGEHLFDVKGADIYTMPTVQLCKGVQPHTLQAVDVARMTARNADLMFALENEAIEFIRDTYATYASANKVYHRAAANQLDFELLAQRASKAKRTPMAIVKQDCDSFDVMPLEKVGGG